MNVVAFQITVRDAGTTLYRKQNFVYH